MSIVGGGRKPVVPGCLPTWVTYVPRRARNSFKCIDPTIQMVVGDDSARTLKSLLSGRRIKIPTVSRPFFATVVELSHYARSPTSQLHMRSFAASLILNLGVVSHLSTMLCVMSVEVARWAPLTARQRAWADSTTLNTIASPAARDPAPLLTLVRRRTVAKDDSRTSTPASGARPTPADKSELAERARCVSPAGRGLRLGSARGDAAGFRHPQPASAGGRVTRRVPTAAGSR